MTAHPVRLPLPQRWERILSHLYFVYQPIVRSDCMAVDGVEALLRGVDRAGFHSIQAVFDTAYAEGVLHAFDLARRHTLLERTATHLLAHQKRLFYNLDTRCVVDSDDEVEQTIRLIETVGLKPHQVCLEISERHQLIPARHVANTLEQYRLQGYGVALDDYGVGYGQLRSLFLTSPDVLKIDRFFVAQADQDRKRRFFLERICQFGSDLGATVVAEGIETEGEMQVCRDIGADLLQGYRIQRPQRSVEAALGWVPYVSSQAERARPAP